MTTRINPQTMLTEYQGQDGEWYQAYQRAPKPGKRDGLSAGQRMTLRKKADLDRGIHPVTRLPLLEPRVHTCGDCTHHGVKHMGNRYHKCDLNMTGGPGTDIRVSWPACIRWEQAS